MSTRIQWLATFAVGMALAAPAEGVLAQDSNPAHNHIGHVLNSFGATPDEDGLLPTARAEAETAVQHAGLAAGDLSNLDAMKMHAAHVLHATDPSQVDGGPGAGFGVKAAADGVAQHIQLAASSDGASDNVTTHAEHVAAAARTVSQRADEVVELIDQIEAAESAAEAAPLVEQLQALTQEFISGRDANGDGQVSWQEGEGGLQHAEQHMGFMAAGEGLD